MEFGITVIWHFFRIHVFQILEVGGFSSLPDDETIVGKHVSSIFTILAISFISAAHQLSANRGPASSLVDEASS